jgi:hypothetical protein
MTTPRKTLVNSADNIWWTPKKCEKCSTLIKYSVCYDCHFCPKCQLWLEGKCSDAECWFCPTRPEKPNFNQNVRIKKSLKEKKPLQ